MNDSEEAGAPSIYYLCASRFQWTPSQTDEALARLGGERALLDKLIAPPEPEKPILCGVGMPAALLLDAFGQWTSA